ncbi:hypothetical protein [Arabidopsis thaliana]|uniref:Signal peptidase complex subunit 2 n=1 Tax=Arabidopsis thaliana TaxID=3702 RepID=O81457_ARATH|nr:contains simlarity to Canis familiaris signal peptidase complex 25 kDa subunit (GB:U12687) [Arabidopsis thaliana]CAB77888.1 hypothetical protein [Arabidopsis thaliana]
MEEKKTESATKNVKKVNLLDHIAIKHLLDESVSDIVTSRGYKEDGSFTSTGLVVSSKLPRFSDQYTLTIDSADPQSISAGKSVQFTKSVTQWLTKDGVLVEGLFWKDVEALVKEYTEAGEPKKKR